MSVTLKTNIKVGSTPIQIEAPTPKALFMGIGLFDQFSSECGNCGSDNIRPIGYRNKGYEFYQLKCAECGHALKISEAKDTGDLYLDKNNVWEPPYQPQGGGGGGGQRHQSSPEEQEKQQYPAPRTVVAGAESGPSDSIPF